MKFHLLHRRPLDQRLINGLELVKRRLQALHDFRRQHLRLGQVV